MLIGVYAPSGMVLHEEVFDNRPGASVNCALARGVEHARQLAVV